MTKRFIVFLFLFAVTFQYAQTRIKVMTYNLMHYPGTYYYDEATNSFKDRTYVLKGILDSYQPDIFSVCELQNAAGAEQILNIALATPNHIYNSGNFIVNQSSNDDSLQQLVFYNQQKLILLSQDVITTHIRDINHYKFKLNSDVDVFLDVFVAHLKASNDNESEYKRWEMVNQFTNYISNLSADSNIIFTGDFNFYDSYESGYQEIIDPTNAIVMKDPINMPGDWSNNPSFASIDTQSPMTVQGHFHYPNGNNDGVIGGMDDRFDFIMLSQNMMSSGNLTYVPDTYKAYGNNGNCFDNYISNPDCSGIYSQDIRNLLFNMSDHIPVVLELETPYALRNTELEMTNVIKIINGNVQSTTLSIEVPYLYLNTEYKFINSLGQIVSKGFLENINQKIEIEHLSKGVYFIQFENSLQALKFIKI